MRLLALLAMGVVLGGCLGGAPGLAGLELTLRLPPAPVLDIAEVARVDREQPAREPAIVQAPDGTLYVAGFWGFARHVEHRGSLQNLAQGPLVWRSTDLGATWQRLEPGLPVDGAISNSDLDLAVAEDGTLYVTALSYYSAPLPVEAEALLSADPATTFTVVVGASGDRGATWRWSLLDRGSGLSHPWVAVQPGGMAHVVWTDDDGVRAASSNDRGAEWVGRGLVREEGTAGGLAAAPDGALAVRIAPVGPKPADGIALSRDSGASWVFVPAPGDRAGDGPRGFDNVAYDAAGALHLAWNEGPGVWIARTTDDGSRWTMWEIAEEPDGTEPYFPYVRGGPAGEVAVTWYARTGDTVAARVAHVAFQGWDTPAVRLGTFLHDTGGPDHADYYQVAILHDGAVAAAVPFTTAEAGQWLDYMVGR